jgi:hypothetical protein
MQGPVASLVGHRVVTIGPSYPRQQASLVKRYHSEQGQRLLEISSTAEAAYFAPVTNDALDVGEDQVQRPYSG